MFSVAKEQTTPFIRRLTTLAAAAAMAVTSLSPALASSSSDFVARLWPDAQARGISRAAFDASFAGFSPDPKVMELTKKQPEFTTTVGDYIGRRVTAAQVAKGRAMAGEWRQTLSAISSRFGVQPEIVLAIWGMETNFGGYMGDKNTVHALATLTHGGYRVDFFRNELLTALKIVSDGHVRPRDMIGSWAGAMGHTQFMPSSFMRFAVDFNGDGRADIWNSVPDALASSGNYLAKHKWRPGETWGYEVKLPQGFDYSAAWNKGTATLREWTAMGITRPNGRAFPRADDRARIHMPAGGSGPAFLLLPNFDVIKRYNNSDSYALAVGHLADRILGGGDFATAWPADGGLNRAQRQEVQALLLRKGYDVGTPDGVIGPKTRAAIIAWQRRAGLLPDGHAGTRLLQALR